MWCCVQTFDCVHNFLVTNNRNTNTLDRLYTFRLILKTCMMLSCLCRKRVINWFLTWRHLFKPICHFWLDVTYLKALHEQLSRRLFAPILLHYCTKRKVVTLKCAILFISVWRLCLNSAIKAFNKKTVCGMTLYCFTWSGKALHQTAGAVQTVSPSPWGGHYDRDEQLKAL